MEMRVSYTPGIDLSHRSIAPSDLLQQTFMQLNEAEQLRQQGKLDHAQKVCESLVRQHPDYMGALHTLGLIYTDKCNYQRALDCLVRAAMLNPRSWKTLTALSGVYLAFEAHEMAAQALEQARLIKPNDANVLTMLGEVYREELELELAQEAYGQAVQLEHDLIPAVFGLGWTYSSIGRDAEAADIFEGLVKRGAGSLEVLYALTSLPPQLLSLDVLAEMDKLVADPNQDMAAFVRAAALDKADRHAKAWEQLVPANRALFVQMQDELNKRRQREQSSLARLRAASITIRRDGSRAGGHPILLFILGPSRSGKTSMERLVGTLPAVKRGYENPIVEKSVRRAMQSASLLSSSSIEYLPPQLDSQCRDIYLEELGRRAGSAQVLTNTHPETIHAVDRIAAVFPNVRFILIKRNLEDVLLRIYIRKYTKGNVYSYDLRSARDHIIWYYQMMDLLAEKLPNAVRIVSYEQMVAEPAAVLRIAADLCELPMSVGSPLPAVGDDRGCALPYRELMADALSG